MRPSFTDEELSFQESVDSLVTEWSDRLHPRQFFMGRGGAARELYRTLGERGWLSLAWPTEVGGRGLPITYEFLLWDTLAYRRAARPDLGPGIVAHVLVTQGTERQKKELLPRLSAGAVAFCLGYSEPEAGSDLAGLRTVAVRDGDEYVVRGEKCWTSDAHHSDYLWLLCRTGPQADRGRALTLLMVDLRSEGVSVMPIPTIDGHQLNAVFLDEVRVPVENRVGAEGEAWPIIREALAVERHLQMLPGRLRRDLEDFVDLLQTQSVDIACEPSQRLTDRLEQVEAAVLRTVAELVAGKDAVAAAARAKLLGTELAQDIPRVAMDLIGAPALVDTGTMPFLWGQSYMETIAGGSSEIMLSLLARQALGLGAKT